MYVISIVSTSLLHSHAKMMGGSHPKSMLELIALLQRKGRLTSARVAEAMATVDRADFVNSSHAYEDHPLSIGYNATISAPHMHAYALERLEAHLKPGAKALDVGSGSGYLCVCMSLMMGEAGRVYGVEHIPQLVEVSVRNASKHYAGLIATNRLAIVQADGREGLPQCAPYDVIHVGAACREVPEALLTQLAPLGRMLLPVGSSQGQNMMIVDKDASGRVTSVKDWSVVYIPLTSKSEQYP